MSGIIILDAGAILLIGAILTFIAARRSYRK